MTHAWTSIPSPIQRTNLTINPVGWTLPADWSNNAGDLTHTAGLGNTGIAYQAIGATDPLVTYYLVANIGGTAGTVEMAVGTHNVAFSGVTYNAGAGLVTLIIGGEGAGEMVFFPSFDFDGTITQIRAYSIVTTGWNVIDPPASSWTPIVKASGTSYTTIPKPSGTITTSYGTPYGMLLAILRPVTVTTDAWTKIGAPSSNWTTVPKAT